MASSIRVKEEEPDDVYGVETDTESEEISLEELQLLDSKFASLLKFPVGCKIWYDVRKSAKPKRCLEGKSASVEGVYLHFENMLRVYKVKTDTPTQYDIFLYEDRLVYGMNCPVQVKNPDTNESVSGVIVCPKLEKKGDNGEHKISYAVQLLDEKKVFVEFGVASERIQFRSIASDDAASRVEYAVQIDKEQSSRGDTDEEKTTCDKAARGSRIGTKAYTNRQELNRDNSGSISTLLDNEDHQMRAVCDVQNREIPDDKVCNNMNASVCDKGEIEDGEVAADRTKRKGGTSWSGVGERPKKQFKTTINVSKNFVTCTCILTIPTWVKQTLPMALFLHLMGVKDGKPGYNIERTKTMTDCSVQISDGNPMRVTITCSNAVMPYSAENVTKAVCMIEQSLVDYLGDQNSAKRLLFELTSTAKGSYATNWVPKQCLSEGLVLKYYNGEKSWWRLFDLPCKWREGSGNDHERCLWQLRSMGINGCKVELFGNNFG
eukprot:CAMPEP_0113372786 /NCGR_PEP_ID=MMETSP0013_2-20120614/718_1 /TAXON_ID=2843 ORGANISM="Skeletonema costatum, Strain 1716" /NCGR_SAMPLE_ID=MMETSP0013_2 /ASSEMBLY_ACC=CAM_ASM_000158 /LENGTH=490 /DNA_ID=CAMNT_0000254697 /DNA_START=38 /DNA_END=1508 /DNA_ORIENTATION=- /assembly_acc=CAM_ASM_000158